MVIDPTIMHSVAEKVKAEILPRTPALKLDPAIIRKIAERVPLFAGMSQPCLLATLATGEHFTVGQGEAVFREGDIGNSFYVLIAGDVVVEKMYDGKMVELARLGPGQCFGEMALVGHDVRTATVRGVGHVVALRFYRELIESNLESAVIVYRNIARILAERLGESSDLLVALKKRSGMA